MRLACLVLVMTTTAAAAADLTVCQASKGTMREYWSWREIDGKKCWFVGRPGSKAKTQLRWESTNNNRPIARRPEIPPSSQSEQDLGSVCCWPDLPTLEREAEEIRRRKFTPAQKIQDRFNGQTQ